MTNHTTQKNTYNIFDPKTMFDHYADYFINLIILSVFIVLGINIYKYFSTNPEEDKILDKPLENVLKT
jgi:hypothetical protein